MFQIILIIYNGNFVVVMFKIQVLVKRMIFLRDYYLILNFVQNITTLTSEIDNAKLLATDNLKKIPNPFETYDTVDMSYYDYLVGDPLMNAGNIFSGWKVNAGFGHCEPGGILFGIPLEQRCYLTDIDASTFDSIISIWRINQEKFASYSPITVQQVFTPPDDDKVKLKFLLRAAGTISAAILERPQTFRAGIYNFIVEWNSLSQRDRTIRSTSPGYLIGTPVMINDPTMPPTIIDNMSCQKQNQLFINICSDPSGCIQVLYQY
ncbi:MAG: hypothetical protein EZS28_040284 [Streblomastix strix]|uniref:Uncharacterized protein n=1 Tax=Streblomastix strix TaxID=222440 RepID=A0A5J4U1M1_9EUKA|nr:MAG: hypothetical protein EZS28_040284 [Streblomastix strix]